MVVTVGVLILGALPSFGEAAQLLDIDSSPSWVVQAHLVEANDAGVLYTQLEREGGAALFWGTWDGAPQRVLSIPAGRVSARRFGEGFIVFSHAEDQVRVERLELTPAPRLTFLADVPDVSSFPDTNSTSALWFGGDAGTWVSDGTPEGTRQVSSMSGVTIAIGDDLYFSGVRAGAHVVSGSPVRNELGEELSANDCQAWGGGESAWLACQTPDGGSELLVTDGTPSGTFVRHAFAGDERLISVVVASADHLVFSGLTSNFTISRVGSAPPAEVPFSCGFFSSIVGDVLLWTQGVSTLAEPAVACRPVTPTQARQVGRDALLEAAGQARFALVDGKKSGVLVPARLPDWPTAPSRPELIGSDGLRALYSTTQGVWLTDGTAKGTRRVGSAAWFFGHSVLAADGRFVAFAENGDEWVPPNGVLGVAGGTLVGRIGCNAFRVGEDRVRHELPSVGCIDAVDVGTQGALLRNSAGSAFLLRAGHEPYPLTGEVILSSGVFCGKKRCWYLSNGDGARSLRIVDLETGANSPPISNFVEPAITPLAGSDFALVAQDTSGGSVKRFALTPEGRRIDFEPLDVPVFGLGPPFAFTESGSLFWITAPGQGAAPGLSALDGRGEVSQPLTCTGLTGLSTTGERANVVCSTSPSPTTFEFTLWSGKLGADFESLTFSGAYLAFAPSGDDEVMGFSVSRPNQEGLLVITDGRDRLDLPGMVGDGFARVRAGYVFAGTRQAVWDAELWVLPLTQTGCGCGSGGEVLMLGLLLLLRRGKAGGARYASGKVRR